MVALVPIHQQNQGDEDVSEYCLEKHNIIQMGHKISSQLSKDTYPPELQLILIEEPNLILRINSFWTHNPSA
jgi:hypothetical protein